MTLTPESNQFRGDCISWFVEKMMKTYYIAETYTVIAIILNSCNDLCTVSSLDTMTLSAILALDLEEC
jgi:hypothetical protein